MIRSFSRLLKLLNEKRCYAVHDTMLLVDNLFEFLRIRNKKTLTAIADLRSDNALCLQTFDDLIRRLGEHSQLRTVLSNGHFILNYQKRRFESLK